MQYTFVLAMGLVLLPHQSPAQTFQLEWQRQFGGVNAFCRPEATCIDALGHLYVAGIYFDTVNFGTNASPDFHIANDADGFVLAVEPDGTLKWSQTFGGTAEENCTDIECDAQGNLYIVGTFSGKCNFGEGSSAHELTAHGKQDVYIQKVTNTGDLVWALQLGGDSTVSIFDLAVDANGNVFLVGTFRGKCDFDPSSPAGLYTADNELMYVAGFSHQGAFRWVNVFQGYPQFVGPYHCEVVKNELVVGGVFHGIVDFDPSPATYTMASGDNPGQGKSAFFMRLDIDGHFVKVNKIDAKESMLLFGMVHDSSGNLFLSGWSSTGIILMNGTTTVVSSPTNLPPPENRTRFVAKLDFGFNVQWCGWISFFPESLLPLNNGKLLLATTVYNLGGDIDPGPADYIITNPSFYHRHGILAEFSASGNLDHAHLLKGDAFNYPYTMELDSYGGIYVAGEYTGTTDFDVGPFNVNHTAKSHDTFIVRFWDGVTGLHDHSGNGISVFPNPAHDVLNVRFPGKAPVSVSINDFCGRTVFTGTTNVVDVTHLPRGFYTVRVVDRQGGDIVHKIVLE